MSQSGPLNVSTSSGSLEFDTDSGTALPIGGIIEILGGSGVTTSGSGNVVTINVVGTGFRWQVVTSADNPVTFAPENGYITKGLTPVQFKLPASASIGDSYKIVGYSNLWTIAQNANQNITLGIATTTSGVTGSVAATSVSDSMALTCVTTNLQWVSTDSVGNPVIT